MRVVLAHASADQRRRFRRVLSDARHDVIEAIDAADAVQRCRDAAPDVAIVDVALCRRDGAEVLHAIKGDPEAYGTAVVLLERQDLDLGTAAEALRRGVQDFLVDPVGDAELIARVESAGRTAVLQQELVEQARRLESLIVEDSLTGLANRRYILAQLAGMVSGARRHERPLAVAIVDVDYFKSVNDRFGHAAGDRALASVAAALRRRLRAEDQLGRLGGEEFLALLADTDAAAVATAVEKLRAEVAASPIECGDRELTLTVSIGWAAWEGEPAEELLRRADDALYEAKARGRDCVQGAPASLQRRT